MMLNLKQIIWIFFLSFNITQAFAIQVKTSYNVKKHVDSLKTKELMNSLRLIVYKSKPNRLFGSEGHKNIREFLFQTASNYKIDDATSVEKIDFTLNQQVGKALYENDFKKKIIPNFKPETAQYKKWDTFKNYMSDQIISLSTISGQNIVWERKGSDITKTLIFTAHYDTVSHDPKTLKIDSKEDMPGADYNASGVAIALGLIKLLHDQNLKYSVRIVFLDAQSIGFLGAYDYAQRLSKEKENILGVINLEMLGFDSKHFDKSKKYFNFKAYMRDEKEDPSSRDLNFFKVFSEFSTKANVNIDFEITRNNFNNSDNFRFWDAGVAAVTLTQNWEDDFNKHYQSPNDFPETINQGTFYNAFQFIARSALGYLLEISP